MRSELHARSLPHVLNQPFEYDEARSVSDDVRMQCEDEHRSPLVGLIEFRAPDGEDLLRRRIGPNGGLPTHPEIRVIVEDPLNRDICDLFIARPPYAP